MNDKLKTIAKHIVCDAIYEEMKQGNLADSYLDKEGNEIAHEIKHGTQQMKDLEFAVVKEFQRVLDFLEKA